MLESLHSNAIMVVELHFLNKCNGKDDCQVNEVDICTNITCNISSKVWQVLIIVQYAINIPTT